jgi:hypothetical protein
MACSPVDSCLNSSPENPRNKNPSEQSADQHAAPGTLVSGRNKSYHRTLGPSAIGPVLGQNRCVCA